MLARIMVGSGRCLHGSRFSLILSSLILHPSPCSFPFPLLFDFPLFSFPTHYLLLFLSFFFFLGRLTPSTFLPLLWNLSSWFPFSPWSPSLSVLPPYLLPLHLSLPFSPFLPPCIRSSLLLNLSCFPVFLPLFSVAPLPCITHAAEDSCYTTDWNHNFLWGKRFPSFLFSIPLIDVHISSTSLSLCHMATLVTYLISWYEWEKWFNWWIFAMIRCHF